MPTVKVKGMKKTFPLQRSRKSTSRFICKDEQRKNKIQPGYGWRKKQSQDING